MRRYISILLVTLSTAPALAAPPSSAESLIEQGNALRQKGQNQEALDLFQKAHALAPSGRTLAQMGIAEATLKRWADAETHLAAALEAHDTPWIENAKNRDAIQRSLVLVRSHIGLVTVVGPAGAEITVGGASVGRLPLAAPLHLPEGRVRIEGSADGRESASVDLPVPGGHELTVHLDLPPFPAGSPVPAAVPAAPPGQAPSLVEHPAVAESTPWKTWAGGGLLAVSAGLLTTGIVWIAVDGNGTCSPPAGARCMRVYDTKGQGWIAVGAAAVSGVVGGILLWQGHQAETRIGLGLGTLTASGTF
jgi:hypothetical protein